MEESGPRVPALPNSFCPKPTPGDRQEPGSLEGRPSVRSKTSRRRKFDTLIRVRSMQKVMRCSASSQLDANGPYLRRRGQSDANGGAIDAQQRAAAAVGNDSSDATNTLLHGQCAAASTRRHLNDAFPRERGCGSRRSNLDIQRL